MKKVLFLLLLIISLYGCEYREPIITEIPASIQAMNRRKDIFYNNNILYELENGAFENIEVSEFLGTGTLNLLFYKRKSNKIFIYEDGEKKWVQSYKMSGLIEYTDIIRFELKSLKKNEKILITVEPEADKNNIYEEIPEIKSIEYNEEKVEFQEGSSFGNLINDYNITQVVENSEYEIKIIKNNEEIGRVIIGGKKGTGVFIKKGTDEEMKKFLFKCALVQIINKNIKDSVK